MALSILKGFLRSSIAGICGEPKQKRNLRAERAFGRAQAFGGKSGCYVWKLTPTFRVPGVGSPSRIVVSNLFGIKPLSIRFSFDFVQPIRPIRNTARETCSLYMVCRRNPTLCLGKLNNAGRIHSIPIRRGRGEGNKCVKAFFLIHFCAHLRGWQTQSSNDGDLRS